MTEPTTAPEAALTSNKPPEPFVLFNEEIDDLMLEARNWCDGEPVGNEEQAEAVSSLINRLRRVSKDADEARAGEKKPHDEAAKAVQTKWLPIIGKAATAITVAREALAPWLKKVDEKQREEAAAAQREADRMAEVAREAHLASSGNLAAREDAERLQTAAEAAKKHATKTGKAKARATGGERAIGLREVWTPKMTDSVAALKYYRERRPEALKDWLLSEAKADVRGGARSLPGFKIESEKVAV